MKILTPKQLKRKNRRAGKCVQIDIATYQSVKPTPVMDVQPVRIPTDRQVSLLNALGVRVPATRELASRKIKYHLNNK